MYDSLTYDDVENLLEILRQEGHIPERETRKTHLNVFDGEWLTALDKLYPVRIQVSTEDEEEIKRIAAKYS